MKKENWTPMARESWAECELEYIRENFRTETNYMLASALGRSYEAVRTRLWKYTKLRRITHWTPEEDSLILQGLKPLEIKKLTGRTLKSIRRRRDRLRRAGRV